MINVQIDVIDPTEEHPEGTAVWSGRLPELPATGDTLEIRHPLPGGGNRKVTTYRVTGPAHWILFPEDPDGLFHSASAIVTVQSWEPPL